MTRLLCLILASLVSLPAAAQRQKLAAINAETPEGQMLQQIGQEEDAAKKLGLMEEFIAKHASHEAAAWIYAQMIPAYTKAGQHDKAMAAGEKLLALDPADAEAAHNALKSAEATKSTENIRKWAGLTSQAARKAAAEEKPKEEDELEGWKNRVDYAKQVDVYSEYSLYAAALAATDPAAKISLVEALQAQNPQSQYLPQVMGQYFLALRQANNVEKAVAVAEKVLEKDQTNEDMLLIAADYHLQKKSEPEKVIAYSNKMVEVMGSKPKPEGVSDADWEKKKNLTLGLGHWMAGITYASQNKFAPADKSLRASLPYIKDDQQLTAQALFYLGLANYKLGDTGKDKTRILDALKFNQQCAAIKSPFQAQAQKNIAAIRSQYHIR